MGLTVKQERYVQGLFKGLSQRQAYKEAFENSLNWKDSTIDSRASELSKDSEILGRLKELQQEEAQKNKWTREKLIQEFEEVKNRCMTAIPVLNSEGVPTGEYKFEHSGANKSLENIGKLMGMYIDKIESKNINLNKDIDNLTPEEIDKEIQLLSKKLGK